MSTLAPPPAWVTDTNVAPPYPLLRCPRCKAIFSDHGIHVCSQEFLHPNFRTVSSRSVEK